MIKRHDIRPRRKRNGNENGAAGDSSGGPESQSAAVSPLAPAGAGAFDDK
jgi:hypothetical protein